MTNAGADSNWRMTMGKEVHEERDRFAEQGISLNETSLTLSFAPRETQGAINTLKPYLIHEQGLSSLSSPSPTHRQLTLHPRVLALTDLTPEVLERCKALQGQWGSRTLDELSPAKLEQLITVSFFSKSRPSAPLTPGLPDTWRRVLSNFHPSPLAVDGTCFPTVEHHFQSQKALHSSRPEMGQWFRADFEGPQAISNDPARAKRAGGRGGAEAKRARAKEKRNPGNGS